MSHTVWNRLTQTDGVERRGPDRLVAPSCEKCQRPTVVALRVEYFVYFRCPACGWITAGPKPAAEGA
jgi:hypothetical protein